MEGWGDIEYAQGKLNRLQGAQDGEEGPWHGDGGFTSNDSEGDYKTAQSHVSDEDSSATSTIHIEDEKQAGNEKKRRKLHMLPRRLDLAVQQVGSMTY